MRALTDFCEKNNLTLVKINYRNVKKKGLDIVNTQTKEILVSFEPYNFPETWYLRHVHNNYKGARYLNRITPKFLNDNINPLESSFFRIS